MLAEGGFLAPDEEADELITAAAGTDRPWTRWCDAG